MASAGDLPRALTADDFLTFDWDQAALGQSLFYDQILSGNQNISCAHCHHPDFGTGDGLSLGIGEGGQGLGPNRTPGVGVSRIAKRIPRNAPGLWNLGARDVHVMFHDGRLSRSDLFGNGFNSPAEEWLPQGLNSLLAAQALFPLVAQFEMAGNPGENEVIGAVHDRIDNAWPIIAKRVRLDPTYGPQFVAAFDHIATPDQVTIVDIANALAAFMAVEWRSIDSPFDAYLAGNKQALTASQHAGMVLFYGSAGCSACHSGPLMSDQTFHALGVPAFGPGRTRMFDPYARDVGRMGDSNRLADAYAFRTPMLRNVALTAPYGHNGAFPTLDGIVRHHLTPLASRGAWRRADANLPKVQWLEPVDFIIQSDPREMARQARVVPGDGPDMTDDQIAQIVAFLHSLTGQGVATPPFGVPADFTP
ncbi:cytochrome c peroxidase [Roseobacter sp.]|uniref:cytochrome-c peroxidase n=1 Tax=Roseobacter sp. TaxID=1907202 RepID=UPI00329953C2